MSTVVGARKMAITEEYVPGDRLCLFNLSSRNAGVELTFCAEGEEPLGPFRSTVPAQRTCAVGLDDLVDPGALSAGAPYAVVVVSDLPVMVRVVRPGVPSSRRPAA
ncbi:sensory rhodopsin transducer [Nonomuraea sp. NPDC050643]|uniref:sensory rhodopsin transducer n=1 Tax=Nonomuraea sp. NPDC050643 TaxID=3155660 RepID=UPI0033D3AC51